MALKIDSNASGLRIAEELSLKTLPGTPIWYPAEPNSFKDFGGQLSTIARNPINAARQRKKGTITDLDASGGFAQDLTQNNSLRLFQGMMFADVREKATTASLKAAGIPITAVSGTQYSAASGLDAFKVNDLVWCSGFGVAGNNGLKKVTAATATTLSCAGLTVEASPPAAAKIELCGHEFASGDITVAMVGGLPRLTSAAFNLTTAGFVPGEWIYVGGDTAATQLTAGTGFARINAIASTYLELDKVDWTPAVDTGVGKTIQVFYGFLFKNESDPLLIKRRTFQLERTLGPDPVSGTMSEYLIGACPNEMTIDMKQADKVTVDYSFVAVDNEQRTGVTGLKSGTRPSSVPGDCFNTTSDFSRIKLSKVDLTTANVTPLFSYATELQLSIKNNVTPNKAIGTLGAFDTSAGTFEVGGKLTAYFSDVLAVKAVRDNADVTIDMALVKNNAGLVFDVPLLALGDGRLAVEQDKAIQLPLEVNAAESKFGHTFLINVFPYLPTIAG